MRFSAPTGSSDAADLTVRQIRWQP